MTDELDPTTLGLAFVLKDRRGVSRSTVNFGELALHPRIAQALRNSFEMEYGHLTVETQKQVWRCCRKLSTFLREEGLHDNVPLPSDMLLRYRAWLERNTLSNSTRQSILNVGISVATACSRIDAGVVEQGFRLDIRSFARDMPRAVVALSEESMKALMKACYEEIAAIETRISSGRELLKSTKQIAIDRERQELLRDFVLLRKDGIPTQRDVIAKGKSYTRRIHDAGGIRALVSALHITARDVLPFYLAVVAQTSGNPMAIRDIDRNCILAHPLRDDVMSVVWSKPRSGREQKADFPIAHRWSAPNLINRLKILNDSLRPWAEPAFVDNLFLAYCNGKVAVPCVQQFHLMLADFISKHNLKNFDFKQLRKTGATLIFRETGDIRVVKNRLNHLSSSTTRRYIEEPLQREIHDQLIHRFQGELISLANGGDMHLATKSESSVGPSSIPSDTTFGFLCRDPFEGLAKGSIRGQACDHFRQCASCPGAIVPLDDPRVVARLLDSLDHLQAVRSQAQANGWTKRFDVLYGPTLSVLETELMPKVTVAVRNAASSLRYSRPLPNLD